MSVGIQAFRLHFTPGVKRCDLTSTHNSVSTIKLTAGCPHPEGTRRRQERQDQYIVLGVLGGLAVRHSSRITNTECGIMPPDHRIPRTECSVEEAVSVTAA